MLFRQAAMDAQRHQSIGRIVLVRPVTFTFLTALGVAIALLLLTFLALGQYTKRAHVQGLLVPEAGLIHVDAPASGLVEQQKVREGQSVQAGQVLFVLNTERQMGAANGAMVSAGAALEKSLQTRAQSLQEESRKQTQLTQQQRQQAASSLRSLQEEFARAEQQIGTQTERVASSLAQLQRWQNLTDQKFVSDLALQQRRDEWLDQRSRLQALEQTRIQLKRQAESVGSDLAQLNTRASKDQEQLKRAESEIEQAKINLQTQRKVVITAPISGIATTLLAEVGQTVNAQTLVTIVPQNDELVAHLYAPSRAAGFVDAGQTVRLRYNAYPYQKFGQYEGWVLGVSRSPVSSQELPKTLANLGQQFGGEGLYRITVKLAKQSVNVYGKAQQLAAGMQLEADIVQDTRTILEWMFESVLSLKGRL